MNTTELVQFVARGKGSNTTSSRSAKPPHYNELLGPLRTGVLLARECLLNEQRIDGSWLAYQAGDASLPSQLILLLAYLGRDETGLIPQAAAAILDSQYRDGGWSVLPGGPIDLSTSVQAYFALKLAGYEPADNRLSMAREVIRQLGGVSKTDVTTRRYLALFRQVSYEACPPVVPEHALLKSWCRTRAKPQTAANRSSAWYAPFAVVWALRPVRDVGFVYGVRELFVDMPTGWANPADPALVPANRGRPWKLRRLRRSLSATVWKQCERWGLTPLRRRALDCAEAELLRSIRPSQIARLSFFDLVWQMIALDALGFSAECHECQVGYNRLLDLVHVDTEAELAQPQLRTLPCLDTAIVHRAICASGLPSTQENVTNAAVWLSTHRRSYLAAASSIELARLIQRLSTPTDELVKVDHTLPPDIHLSESRFSRCESSTLDKRNEVMVRQLVEELVARQNCDGGWSGGQPATRRGRKRRHQNKQLRSRKVASTSDTTGIVLEVLASCGRDDIQPVLQRAVQFLRHMQRADGSWDSATGVRFIHGTSAAICGLIAAGLEPEDETIAAGINWLIVHQHASGGWGETAPAHLEDMHFYVADLNSTQSAWALSAMVASGLSLDPAALRAVRFLLDSQAENGQWHDVRPVQRDHELGRWYRDDLRAIADPLLALSQWAVAAAASHSGEVHPVKLRLIGSLVDD